MLCLNNNCYICDHNIEYPNIDEYTLFSKKSTREQRIYRVTIAGSI